VQDFTGSKQVVSGPADGVIRVPQFAESCQFADDVGVINSSRASVIDNIYPRFVASR